MERHQRNTQPGSLTVAAAGAQAELCDAEEMLRSLQHMMLFLVAKVADPQYSAHERRSSAFDPFPQSTKAYAHKIPTQPAIAAYHLSTPQ